MNYQKIVGIEFDYCLSLKFVLTFRFCVSVEIIPIKSSKQIKIIKEVPRFTL